MRKLCKPWGVQPTEKKASGNYGYRTDTVLRNELTMVFVDRAKKYCAATESETQQFDPKSIVTERATAQFSLKGAMAEALQRIKAFRGNASKHSL